MIYLDGDIQVYENIDHLFDRPDGYFYAVMDCFCEKTWSHTPQYKIGYCQQCPDKVQWPKAELGEPPALYFNAGMFLFEPNLETYEDLLRTLKITPPTPFAEQVMTKSKLRVAFLCYALFSSVLSCGFDCAGFSKHVLQENLQADSFSVQPRPCDVMASSRKCRAWESQGGSLLCSGELLILVTVLFTQDNKFRFEF